MKPYSPDNLIIFLVFTIFLSFSLSCKSYENDEANIKRSLASRKGKSKRGRSQIHSKSAKLANLISSIQSESLPSLFQPEIWSKQHRPTTPYVIFAAAMSKEMMGSDVKDFCGTARKVGFKGDIVLAMEPGSRERVIHFFKTYETIVYNITLTCENESNEHERLCTMYDTKEKYSINMIRYYLYKWWASKYDPNTLIMVSDFRDVFFQMNPFTYRINEWLPPKIQLAVFQEAHPNSVINRCNHNRGWIENCYGHEALLKIGHNTAICSGVSFGTRDAILAYSYLMTQHTDPAVRSKYRGYARNWTESDRLSCISPGMDQGFHNWLVYSGILSRFMDIRIFQQGEGPVNTVGGFYGNTKILRFNLSQWRILRGSPPHAYIANWNGDRSPVVHQLDRFLPTEAFKGDYRSILDAMDGLY